MKTSKEFPIFDESFASLNQFILELVKVYNAGELNSWDELDVRVKLFFTQEMMQSMEAKIPGWKKMASYADGITLTHVTCVFLGLYMLPEFRALSADQQQIVKWIILLHDIDKFHIRGKKDTMHAFNSAVVAANMLPGLGFPIDEKYYELISSWSEYTRQAFILSSPDMPPKPDNRKLPKILSDIDDIFGENIPANLIIKTILLHISLDVDKNYPAPAPLTESEIKRFIRPSLLPLLKVMVLADNEGWSLFDQETRMQQRNDRVNAFERIQELVGTFK